MKQCSKCKQLKALSRFSRVKTGKPKLRPDCKDCAALVFKNWRKKHPRPKKEKKKQSPGKWRGRQWVTNSDYQKMLKTQNGVCAICGNHETGIVRNGNTKGKGKVRALAVDHCHKTGKIRGLLCGQCNIALGAFKDDTDILASAASYLLNSRI
jgi:hypothetical protein